MQVKEELEDMRKTFDFDRDSQKIVDIIACLKAIQEKLQTIVERGETMSFFMSSIDEKDLAKSFEDLTKKQQAAVVLMLTKMQQTNVSSNSMLIDMQKTLSQFSSINSTSVTLDLERAMQKLDSTGDTVQISEAVMLNVSDKANEHFPATRQQAIRTFNDFMSDVTNSFVASNEQDCKDGKKDGKKDGQKDGKKDGAKVLWIKGNAGAGKSVLTTTLFQHHCPQSVTVHQSIFMCKHDRQERQNIFTIAASMAYQLSLQNSTFANEVKTMKAITPSMRSAKTLDAVGEVLEVCLANPLRKAFDAKTLTEAVIFIDALDELLPPVRYMLVSALLSKMQNSVASLPFVRIVLSSRLDDDIVRAISLSSDQQKAGDVCKLR